MVRFKYFLLPVLIRGSMDWTAQWGLYQTCISTPGMFVDMHSSFLIDTLPPCVSSCTTGTGNSIASNKFCTKSSSYAVETQAWFDFAVSCRTLSDSLSLLCQWDTGQAARLALDTFMSILEVKFAHKLEITPEDVTCENYLFPTPSSSPGSVVIGPPPGRRLTDASPLTDLVLVRADEDILSLVSNSGYPPIPSVSAASSATVAAFACRIDTDRLLESDISPLLSGLLTDLHVFRLGTTLFKTKSAGPVVSYVDSDYTLYYRTQNGGWLPSLPITTTAAPLVTTLVGSTTPSSTSTSSTNSFVFSSLSQTSVLVTSAPTASYTGPGVVPAEDPEKRNQIIIGVLSGVFALGVVAALILMFLKRKAAAHIHHVSIIHHEESQKPGTETPSLAKPSAPPASEIGSPRNKAEGPTTPSLKNSFSCERGSPRPASPTKVHIPENASAEEMAKAKAAVTAELKRRHSTVKESRKERIPLRKSKTEGAESLSIEELDVMSTLRMTHGKDAATKGIIYKDLVKQWHPDKHPPEMKKIATKVFQLIQSRKDWYLTNSSNSA